MNNPSKMALNNKHLFNSLWSYFLFAVVVVFAAYRYALPIKDGDIWFHLTYAKYYLQNLTLIPDHTVFSWTPTTNNVIYCCWFAQLFLYGLFKSSGLLGFYALRYFIIFSAVLLILYFAKKKDLHFHPLTYFICFLTVTLSYTGITLKPTIFSYFFFAIYCYTWFILRENPEKYLKLLYIFPAIMLVWVNSHGNFIFGCLFILIVNIGELLNTWFSPQNCFGKHLRKHLVIASVLSLFAIFLTPYGVQYPLQIFNSFVVEASDNIGIRTFVGEFGKPFLADSDDSLGYALCGNLAVAILLITLLCNFRKIEWSLLLLNLVFLILYTMFFRTTFFWPLIFCFSSISLLSTANTNVPEKIKKLFNVFLPPVTVTLILSIASILLYRGIVAPQLFTWQGFGLNSMMPIEETEYIKTYFPEAKIGNTYNQGSYLMWHLWPENKIYVDARFFPYKHWFKNDFYFNIEGDELKSFLDTYKADIWIIDPFQRRMLNSLHSSPEWKLAFNGARATIFIRKNFDIPDQAPRRSSRFDKIENMQSAIMSIFFSLSINDMVAVDAILEGMKKNFSLFQFQREQVADVQNYVAAAKNYLAQKYAKALDFLDNRSRIAIKDEKLHANILIHLSIQAWNKDERKKAKELNNRAYEIYPQDVNVYNAGIMNWLELQSKDLGNEKKSILDNTWRQQLTSFLSLTQGSDSLAPYKKTAQKILENTYLGTPSFIVPK